MVRSTNKTQHDILSSAAHPLSGEPSDYDALMDRIGDACVGMAFGFCDSLDSLQQIIRQVVKGQIGHRTG
jgi:hypothetical protein